MLNCTRYYESCCTVPGTESYWTVPGTESYWTVPGTDSHIGLYQVLIVILDCTRY